MSRRSTPERIDEARHAATRNRLIGDGATPETADAWIAAWAEQAARDGVQRGAATGTPDGAESQSSGRGGSAHAERVVPWTGTLEPDNLTGQRLATARGGLEIRGISGQEDSLGLGP
jgi:hypothetical protein